MNENEHWTENEELREAFVFRRLWDDELVVMQRHLDGCPDCRKRISAERALADGVRHYARESLKQRLADRVERASGGYRVAMDFSLAAASAPAAAKMSEPAPAPMPPVQSTKRSVLPWFAMAASLVVIVGVGLLNRWWGMWDREQQSPSTEIAKTETIGGTHEGPIVEEKRAIGQPDDGSTVQGKSPTSTSQSSSSEQLAVAPGAKDVPSLNEAKESLTEQQEARHVVADKLAGEAVAGGGQAEPSMAPTPTIALPSGVESGDWREGQIRNVGEDVAPGSAMGTTDASRASDLRRGSEAMAKAKGESASSIPASARLLSQARLSQRPLSDAPLVRQQVRHPQSILSKITSAGEELHIVLYPDSAFDERELQEAKVFQIGPDSLSIVMQKHLVQLKFGTSQTQPAR